MHQATVQPSRPFGVGLFGSKKGAGLDLISPDVVAFLIMNVKLGFRDCGPILYGVDALREELAKISPDQIAQLERTNYRISPDQGLTNSPNEDYGFGGAAKINILGMRKGLYPYMRFVVGRTANILPTEHPIRNLETALRSMKDSVDGAGMHVQSGDILLVNNRRTATHWVKKSVKQVLPNIGKKTEQDLRDKDRTVLRMKFYLTEPLPGIETETDDDHDDHDDIGETQEVVFDQEGLAQDGQNEVKTEYEV